MDKGISFVELARRLDISAQELSELETGDWFPDIPMLRRLAYIGKVKVNYFFHGNLTQCARGLYICLKDMLEVIYMRAHLCINKLGDYFMHNSLLSELHIYRKRTAGKPKESLLRYKNVLLSDLCDGILCGNDKLCHSAKFKLLILYKRLGYTRSQRLHDLKNFTNEYFQKKLCTNITYL